MRRDTVDRVWSALCAGRAPADVAARFGVALAIVFGLYLSGFVFLMLEPAR